MNHYESSDDAAGMRFAVVVSRFNHLISVKLLDGCTEELVRRGASDSDIDVAGRVAVAFASPVDPGCTPQANPRDVVQDREQKILLGRKEVVEAAAGGIRLLDDLVDTGLRVALAPKELGGGGDQACAGCGFARYQGVSRRKFVK